MYVRSPLSVYLLLEIAYKFSTNRLDFCPFVRSSGVYSGLIHSQGRRILISFQPTRKHITMITGPKVNWSLIQMVPQSNQFNNEFAQFNLSSFCKIQVWGQFDICSIPGSSERLLLTFRVVLSKSDNESFPPSPLFSSSPPPRFRLLLWPRRPFQEDKGSCCCPAQQSRSYQGLMFEDYCGYHGGERWC